MKMISKQKLPVAVGVSSVSLALMYIFPIIFYLLSFVVYSAALIFIVVKFVGNKNSRVVESEKTNNNSKDDKRGVEKCNEKINIRDENNAACVEQSPKKILMSSSRFRSIDEIDKSDVELSSIFTESCLDEDLLHTIDCCLGEVFKPWQDKLISNDQEITNQLRHDFWQGIVKLTTRLRHVNLQKLLSDNFFGILESHIENSMHRVGSSSLSQEKLMFEDEEKEMDFLKKISEILIIILLPREYCVSPVRVILCEIIAYKCFYCNISELSNPDFLNQKLIDFIKHRIVSEKPVEENDGSILALSKRVDSSTTIDDLLHIRSSLLNDLFQALSINQNATCGIFAKTRKNCVKLREYIRSLSSIKGSCEEKLEILGLPDLSKYNLTLKDILATVIGRRYFTTFLKSSEAKSLVILHNQIFMLRESPETDEHREYVSVLHSYLKSLKTFQFENDICNHDTLTDIQKKILDILEEKYYHAFVVNSKEYEKLSNLLELTMTESQKSPIVFADLPDIDLVKLYVNKKNHLGELKEALTLKQEIYECLSRSQPSIDLNTLKMCIEKLIAKEELCEQDLEKIECWLTASDSIKITSVECVDTERFENFKITYKIDESEEMIEVDSNRDDNEAQSSAGRLVTIYKSLDCIRKFNEDCSGKLCGHESTKTRENFLNKLKASKLFTEEFLEILFNQYGMTAELSGEMMGQFKEYLNYILDNSDFQESERVFVFFNSSVEAFQARSVEDLLTPTAESGFDEFKNTQNYDPIIEKIINTMSNKDVIGKFFDGPNLKEKYQFSFLSNLLRGSWKDTSESKSTSIRTDEMREMTMKLAKDLIIENIPTLLKIYEYQRPKRSLIKLFNIFQDKNQNRKLIYDLIEALLIEVFPEMQKIQQTMSKTY